jgi:nucleotide-binding universal stress UspA family protein
MSAPDKRPASNRAFVVPDRILVATDLADTEYLIPHAIAQARACGAALTFVHVIPPGESAALNARAIPHEDSAAMAEAADRKLKQVAAQMRENGIPCDLRVAAGFPRDEITAIAREIHAGRIIAGTHGRQHLRRFLLGSVAHEILRSAEVPVYTIGPQAHEASSLGAPRKILHPVSLTSGFEESARAAIEIAQFYRADITLLHVLSPDLRDQGDADRIVEWTKSEMQRIVPDEAALWTHVTAQVEVGDAVDEVLNVDAEMQADLIVLGVNHEGAFSPIRGDDTVYKIIARAKSPVLSIRHGAEKRR